MAASPPTGSRAALAPAPPASEGARQPQPETRRADRDGPLGRRFADRFEVALEHRIHNRGANALFIEFGKPTHDRRAALGDRRQGDETDRRLGLALQDAHEIGIAHRIQRMILERALVQGNVADEQMTEIDGASRLRKSGRHHDAPGAGAGAERLADRPDVSGIGGVESRADFVDDVARPAGHKPVVAGGRRRTALGASTERIFSATTIASTSPASKPAAGTPIVWIVERPLRLSVFARSDAPV